MDGKCAAGGQKYRWNDLVSRDLKSCKLSEDWHKFAHSLSLWKKVIHDCVESLNVLAEKEEKRRKDERKKLRERRQVDAEVALCCTHPACVFVAVNKAGLTNHTCQKHVLPIKSMCQFCKQLYHQQGLHNHQKRCNKRSRAT